MNESAVKQRSRLRCPRARVAINAPGPQDHEGGGHGDARDPHHPPPPPGLEPDDLAEPVARGDHPQPGEERVADEHVHATGQRQQAGSEQKRAGRLRRGGGPGARQEAAGQAVRRDQQHPERPDHPARQEDQPRQHDERGPDRPQDRQDHRGGHGIEKEAEPDDRQLEEDQPEPPGGEERREVAPRPASGARQIGARPREEGEHRCAEVGHPPRQEQRRTRLGQVRGVDRRVAEVVAGVIEHHQHHHGPAEDVDGVDASSGRRRCAMRGVAWSGDAAGSIDMIGLPRTLLRVTSASSEGFASLARHSAALSFLPQAS